MFTPKHIPQPFTQKLLDFGVIEFSETTVTDDYVCECYDVTRNFIMSCEELDTIYVFTEYYDMDDQFEMFMASSYGDDVKITTNSIEIYKKMNIK
jgi:hypothetical protein